MKIVGAQPVTKNGDIDGRHERRKPIPPHEDVDDAIGYVQKSLQPCLMKFEAVVFARHLLPGGNPFFVKPYRALNDTALCVNVKRAT